MSNLHPSQFPDEPYDSQVPYERDQINAFPARTRAKQKGKGYNADGVVLKQAIAQGRAAAQPGAKQAIRPKG